MYIVTLYLKKKLLKNATAWIPRSKIGVCIYNLNFDQQRL